MEEPANGGASPPKPKLPDAAPEAAELPAALQSSTTGDEEDAGAVGLRVAGGDNGSSKAAAARALLPPPPPPPRVVAPFDLDFDNEAAASSADRDDLLLDWRRYSNEGQGFSDYGVGSRALGFFLSGLAFLGRKLGLRDDYDSGEFVAASLPPPPPAWWLRQTRARKRAILMCGAVFLAAGTLALVAVAGAVALRSSTDDFLSEGASVGGGSIFGGGTWPATGAPECAWSSWRLPQTVAPTRYRLSLALSDLESDDPRVDGDVAIDLSLVSPSSPPSPSSSSSATAAKAAGNTAKPQRCIVLHAAEPVRLDSAAIAMASPSKKKKETKGEREEEEAGSESSSPPPFDVSTHRITTWRFDSSTDQLTLLLPVPLEAHQAATLRLRFSYALPDALEGLYRSTWTEEKEEESEGREAEKEDAKGSNPPRKTTVLRAAAVSQFEANSARTAFPCFDEPALRAPFAVFLVADEGLAVISNMPEVSVEEVELEEVSESSRKRRKKKKAQNAPRFPPPPSSSSLPRPRRLRHVFEPTPAMPTYLVAVVVGPLVAVPGGHLLPPPTGSTPLPLPPPRTTMPPLGNEYFASPPSEAAFDAAAAAAGLAPWMRASSPSFSSTKQRPLTLYARKAAAPLLRLAARAARGALAAHERALGTRYALPHLQVIAVPDFSANAMENWGAVVFREAALLLLNDEGEEDNNEQQQKQEEGEQLDEASSSLSSLLPSPNAASAERRVALILAHELAHMFFGDGVGFRWWSELWLSEGFARYFEHGAAAAALAEVMTTTTRKTSGSSVVNFFEPFFDSTTSVGLRAASRSRSGHALSARSPAAALHSNAGIESMFDRVEYEHGAGVLRMLRAYINAGKEEKEADWEGEGITTNAAASASAASAFALDDGAVGGGSNPNTDRFLAGLRDYQRRHALRAASSAELFDALQPHAVAFEQEEEEVEEEEGMEGATSSSAFAANTNGTVSSWMRSWTSYRGAPLLLVRLDEVTGDVHLEQATLMSSGGGSGSGSDSSSSGSSGGGGGIRAVPCDDASVAAPDGNPGVSKNPTATITMPPWWIPLRVATSAEPRPHWLREGEQPSSSSSRRHRKRARVLSSCSTSTPIARLSVSSSSSTSSSSSSSGSSSSWIKVNAGAVAPVRVSYPDRLWLSLSRAAAVTVDESSPPTPLISGADLSQLLSDSDALSEAGIAPVSAFLNLTRALGRRPPGNADLGAWRAAAVGLRRMREFLSSSQGGGEGNAGGDNDKSSSKLKKCAFDLDAYVSRKLLSRFVEFDFQGGDEGDGGGDGGEERRESNATAAAAAAASPSPSSPSPPPPPSSPPTTVFSVADGSSPPWSLLRAPPRSAPNALRVTRALVLGLAADFGSGPGGGVSASTTSSSKQTKSFEGAAWSALRRGLAAARREENSSSSSSLSSSSSSSSSHSYLYLGDADARGVLYSAAVSAGGQEAFDAIKQIYEEQEVGKSSSSRSSSSREKKKNTADPAERERALFALAHAGSEDLARAALDYSVSEKVRSQDAASLASSVASANGGKARRVCWDWLLGNKKGKSRSSNGAALLAAKKGGGGNSGDGGARAVGKLFETVASGLAPDGDGDGNGDDKRSLRKLEKEIERAAKSLRIKQRRHVDSALEGVRARWSWRRHNREEACRWLAAEVD